MVIRQIKTRRFIPPKDNQSDLLSFIPRLKNASVVAISSKVVSICEGQTRSILSIDHDLLVNQLASRKLEPIRRGKNGMILTQVGNLLVESAGIDISNANGYYVLLPRNPYKTARSIWNHLKQRDGLKHVGVIITDSHSIPRRKGAVGFALSAYGFKPTRLYSDQTDLFGRSFKFTASDLADGLAAAAVLTMGEGSELTPLAVMTDLYNIDFYSNRPSLRQAKAYSWVNPDLDVYSPLLKSTLWAKTR